MCVISMYISGGGLVIHVTRIWVSNKRGHARFADEIRLGIFGVTFLYETGIVAVSLLQSGAIMLQM